MRDRAMRRLIPYVAAIVGVALTSVFIGLVVGRTQLANISMLYLVAVLLVAVAFGRAAAIAASLLAFLTFDWFFVPPTHQLVVADAEELFSLALFLMTAVVTGTLAARERARAEEAKAREREATLLYEAALLMADPDLERALAAVAGHFRAALDLDAVAIESDPGMLERAAVAARDKASLETEVLRRADDLKTELLHAVSHELRTPLASILASAGSLLQRDVAWTERERDEFVGAIRDEALRLDRVVGNLLDLSRIENGSLVPHKAWHDVGALVEDVAGRLPPVAAGHPLDLDVPDDLPPVELDYVEIQQVLANLVENAAKFSPPGSAIGISVAPANGDVRFAVTDHGPGIPEADAERIFAPFVRLDRQGLRTRGVGLRLAIAKRLVEAHRGSIWVDREVPEGTRVVFTLPVSAR